MAVPATLAAHYQQLLGLVKPWKITDINLDITQQRLDITLEWPRGQKAPCPECGKRCGLKDHLPVRTWRHLDSMQLKTFLHCRIPRSECPTHGARTITVPWAESGSQWTLLFEAFAVLVMGQVASLSKAATLLGVSWKEAHTPRKQAVERGLGRRSIEQIGYVGIDEFVHTRFAQSRIGRMWSIKEAFRQFWNYVTEGWAARYFKRWYVWATHSRIPELIRVAKMLKAHLANILTYFRHGMTNAFIEGMNSKIQEIKSAARGFRNFENYRIAILFYSGKIDIGPLL